MRNSKSLFCDFSIKFIDETFLPSSELNQIGKKSIIKHAKTEAEIIIHEYSSYLGIPRYQKALNIIKKQSASVTTSLVYKSEVKTTIVKNMVYVL